jgi:hypothetical protein
MDHVALQQKAVVVLRPMAPLGILKVFVAQPRLPAERQKPVSRLVEGHVFHRVPHVAAAARVVQKGVLLVVVQRLVRGWRWRAWRLAVVTGLNPPITPPGAMSTAERGLLAWQRGFRASGTRHAPATHYLRKASATPVERWLSWPVYLPTHSAGQNRDAWRARGRLSRRRSPGSACGHMCPLIAFSLE